MISRKTHVQSNLHVEPNSKATTSHKQPLIQNTKLFPVKTLYVVGTYYKQAPFVTRQLPLDILNQTNQVGGWICFL